MKTTRLAVLLVSVGAMLAVQSCGDATIVQPRRTAAPASNDLLGTLETLVAGTGLLSCNPLPSATATATIGPMGGRISAGASSLVIPAGALSAPVTITATAPSDNVNRVHFEPHGLVFQRPASLTISYANCGLIGSLLPRHIAYVDGDLNILYLLDALDNVWQRTVTSNIQHFSDYALAW